jgi:HK97 gp10 family phage protein
MKIELKDMPGKLTAFAKVVQAKAKEYILNNAFDTGDLRGSISISEVTESNGIYEISVFSDKTLLYAKRIKYKNSTDKYPIYVHQGTSKMEARPYLTIAFEQTKPLFKDITPTIKVENDNK